MHKSLHNSLKSICLNFVEIVWHHFLPLFLIYWGFIWIWIFFLITNAAPQMFQYFNVDRAFYLTVQKNTSKIQMPRSAIPLLKITAPQFHDAEVSHQRKIIVFMSIFFVVTYNKSRLVFRHSSWSVTFTLQTEFWMKIFFIVQPTHHAPVVRMLGCIHLKISWFFLCYKLLPIQSLIRCRPINVSRFT